MKNEKNATLFRSNLASGIQKLLGHLARALVAAGVLLGLPCSAPHAEVVISNLPNTVDGGSTVSNSIWKAMLFTTGSSPTQLASVVVGLNPPGSLSPPITPNVEVSLFSVVEGAPAAKLTTTGLVSVDMQARQELYTFFDASPFSLEASTSYALVLSSDASEIKWGRKPNATPIASSGFEYGGFLQSLNGGGTWSSESVSMDNAVAINVVPEPSTMLLFGMGAVGGLGIFVGRTTCGRLAKHDSCR